MPTIRQTPKRRYIGWLQDQISVIGIEQNCSLNGRQKEKLLVPYDRGLLWISEYDTLNSHQTYCVREVWLIPMGKEVLTRNIQRIVRDAKIVEMPLELCPELKVYLISADNIRRPFSEKEIGIILDNTPYWTFCWASGHALAYYILKKENQVKGRTVLDFGSGSGAVAIAAAMAGAGKVFACDNDDDALDAIAANADLNNVHIRTCASVEEICDPIDIVIAADVFYERENYPYLKEFLQWAPEVLVAESYLDTIDVAPYQKISEITTTTVPDLDEALEFRRAQVFRAVVA